MKTKSILSAVLLILVAIAPIMSFSQSYDTLTQQTTSSTNTSNPNDVGFTPTYTNSRWSEQTMDAYMARFGIGISNGVTLYGLGNFAVTGVVSLKRTVDYYNAVVQNSNTPSNIVIYRGTETYGQDTPVLDLQDDPVLDTFITNLATNRGITSSGNLYQLGDDYFFKESSFWHVIFGPSNGAFVKDNIPFFGVVRDNFSVTHPNLTSSNVPSSVAFNRTLYLGASGQDVLELQKLLNTDPYTQVAASGPGSPGSETIYFGSKTQAAVDAYQYKNNEILDAAGVTSPTGIVASFTRAHLTAYWNYLNTQLNGIGDSPVLPYPTPTKPLQDIPLNGQLPTGSSGNTSVSATTTSILINSTPNAPAYSGDINDLPIQSAPTDLNNTVAFDTPPTVNGSNVTDPNNAANQSSAQQSPLQQALTSLLPSLLSKFLGGGSGGLAGGASAGLKFGGRWDIVGPDPCNCPTSIAQGRYVVNDNSAYSGNGIAVALWLPTGVGPTVTVGSCNLGNYVPFSGTSVCYDVNENGEGCHVSPAAANITGRVTLISPQNVTACH